MKNLSLVIFFLFIGFIANSQEGLKYCGSDELRIHTLKKNPKIANAVIKRDEVLEAHTKLFVEQNNTRDSRSVSYIIPIVFHVIHNYGTENISDAQILDGLSILNKTFRKQLADTASIVAAFKPLHADCEIEFRLAQLDPDGNCTSGINRIASPLTAIGDHSVKSLIQWPPNQYLNVYIVDYCAGLAGHCVWPSDADTIPAWDGIVIEHDYVGSIGTSNYTQSVAFAHEAGHYLNLQHIWGGNNVPGFYYYPCADPFKDCSIDDLVADTPPTIGWQTCNLSASSCLSPIDNVQNTMDYSYCNRMFTYGQKARMHACLNSPIAGRNNLWSPANLIATGVDTIPGPLCSASFTANKTVVCESSLNTITYTNTSYNGTIDSLIWSFPGGTPTTSTLSNPAIVYTVPGKYDVSLKVYAGGDSVEILKPNLISVLPDAGLPYPYTEDFESTTGLNGLDWFENSFDTLNRWELTNTTAFEGSTSVMLNNYDNTMATKDELLSEIIDLSGGTGLSISFKYAFAKKDTVTDDKLMLMITNTCNGVYIPRSTLVVPALETAPQTSLPFVPSDSSQWKKVVATIPATYCTAGFRFKFLHTSSGGNNLYIDDINLSTTSAIDDLNMLGANCVIYPNPATGIVNVSLDLDFARQLNIRIIDMTGRILYDLPEYNFNQGKNEISVNIADFAEGMYTVLIGNGEINLSKPLVVLPR